MVMVITRSTPVQLTIVNCIICGAPIQPGQAISGSLYAGGQQAYACSGHIFNRREWVPAWATFETTQQHTHTRPAARTREQAQ